MSKRRRNGKGRRAYLKKAKHAYDPYSPYALKTRGAKSINIGALIREPGPGPAHKRKLIPIEYHATQTHGIRGLTLSRATGPTAKAAHVGGAPTTIPLAELAQRRIDVAEGKSKWASQRFCGVDEWKRQVIWDCSPSFVHELWFEGSRFVLVEYHWEDGVERRSKEYTEKKYILLLHKRRELIKWESQTPLPVAVPPTA